MIYTLHVVLPISRACLIFSIIVIRAQGFSQALRTWVGVGEALQNLMGSLSQHMGEQEGLKLLKDACEGVHLLIKLLAICLEACKFSKNELQTYFSRILARFLVLEFQEHLFLKAPFNVSFCYYILVRTHILLYIQSPRKMLFVLTIHSYSFLPFLYNISCDRLAELKCFSFLSH